MRFAGIVSLFLITSFSFLGCVRTEEKVVATVGGENVYFSDMELMFKERRILSDNPGKSRYVSNIYRDISQEQIGKKMFPGIEALVAEDMRQMETRLLTSVYQRFYAFENLFSSEKELREFYLQDTAKFAINGKNYPFYDVRGNVAEALYIKKHADDYEKFFNELRSSMETPATAEVLYRSFSDSLAAENFKKSLETETDISKLEGLQKASVKKEISTDLLGQNLIQNEIFKDYTAKRCAVISLDFEGKKMFVALQVSSIAKEVQVIPEELERSARKRYIEKIKKEIMATTGTKLVEKYALEIVPPKPVDPSVYYEKNAEKYTTNPGLYVYHIQNKDSSFLAKELSKVSSLEEFSALASSSKNENAETRAKSGEMGSVLEEHSLPYGVGLLPNLFSSFAQDSLGKSPVLKGSNTFHAFFATKRIQATRKPFERVKNLIVQELENDVLSADPEAPLVAASGKPVLFEKDLKDLYLSLPQEEAKRYNRKILASYLMEWYAFAAEARSVHLDTTAIYKAILRKQERMFAKKYIVDSVKKVKQLSEKEALPYFEKYGKAFAGRSIGELLPELSELAVHPENDLRYEYFKNELLDSGDYILAIPKTLASLSKSLEERLTLRFSHIAELETPLVVKDSAFLSEKPWGKSAAEMLQFADTLFAQKQLDKSLWDYSVLRVQNPKNDSVYAYTTFRLAQVHSEREEFEEALKEYNAFLGMWPEHPMAEKALFAKGFMLEENLNRPQDAVTVYRQFLKKYPKTELSESVEWLLKNIENNGKLAKELIEKIEKE